MLCKTRRLCAYKYLVGSQENLAHFLQHSLILHLAASFDSVLGEIARQHARLGLRNRDLFCCWGSWGRQADLLSGDHKL
ncbi:hypothetical protein FOVSG1_009189 [Fusarium oxysporum f. sp. vasinfectum]